MRHYIYICMLFAAAASAQRPTVTARLEPDSIGIGDRTTLEVTVRRDMMQMVDFPNFEGGHLTKEIEIVDEGTVDTLAKDGRQLTLQRRYQLTTFEDGEHHLGRFPMLYSDKNVIDTLYSADSVTLRVGTFVIDTATMQLRDIGPVAPAPFKPGEVSLWVIGGAWGITIIALVAYVVWRRLRRREKRPAKDADVVPDTPHLAAIKALEELHSQKLWQNNRHKQYYTRLTDILRKYLEGRWGVQAMEMTSGEILEAATAQGVSGVPMTSLKTILRSADLVKFAKHKPEAEENETAYTQAYYFVEETKKVEATE